jgi:hypothetical protein
MDQVGETRDCRLVRPVQLMQTTQQSWSGNDWFKGWQTMLGEPLAVMSCLGICYFFCYSASSLASLPVLLMLGLLCWGC